MTADAVSGPASNSQTLEEKEVSKNGCSLSRALSVPLCQCFHERVYKPISKNKEQKITPLYVKRFPM